MHNLTICAHLENIHNFKVKVFHKRKAVLKYKLRSRRQFYNHIDWKHLFCVIGYWLTKWGNNRSHSLQHAVKKKKVDTIEGVLTLVLLSRGVGSGVARYLEGEKHLSPTLCHPGSLQLPMVGAQEEEGVETGVEARGGRPEIHAAAPQD